MKNNEVIKFISNYITLTQNEVDIINDINLIKTYKKDSVLLSKDQYAKNCFFILKGCIRRFYLIDGEVKNTEFYIENQTITPISYLTGSPSEYSLACLEDCIVSVGTNESNAVLLKKVPKLVDLVSQLNQELMIKNQISFDDFKNLSAENRYIKLLKERPDLLNRIPQYHLASYLGITPISLSRIRKRIAS